MTNEEKYQKQDIWFEPHPFSTGALFDDNPFVKEIVNTGKEIKVE
jgi:hypothetical protein